MSDQSSSPVSLARLRANRRNARKSTGPRTEQGKAVSSRNSLVHGLYCAKDVVLPGESEAEFLLLRQSYIQSLLPIDAIELSLVERIVKSQWKLQRAEALEHQQHELAMEKIELSSLYWLRELKSIAQRISAKTPWMEEEEMTSNPPPWNSKLPREQAFIESQALIESVRDESIPPEQVQAISFQKPQELESFEKLQRHQQRLEGSIDKALRELDRLRKARSRGRGRDQSEEEPKSCPYLEDMEQIEQMLEAEEQQKIQREQQRENAAQPASNKPNGIELTAKSCGETELASPGMSNPYESEQEDDGIERNQFGEPVKRYQKDDRFG